MCPVFGFNTDIRYGDTVYHVQTEAHESDRTLQTAVFVRGRCVDKQETSYAQESTQPTFSEGSLHQLLTQQHRFVVNAIREGRFGSLMTMRPPAQERPFPPQPVQEVPQRPAPPPLPIPIPRPNTPVANPVANVAPLPPPEEDLLGVEPEPTPSSDAPQQEAVLELPVAASVQPDLPATSAPELKLELLTSDSVIAAGSAKLRYRLTLGSRGIAGAKLVARLELGRIPAAYARSVTDCEGEAEVQFKLPASAANADSVSFTAQVTHSGQSVTRRFSLNRKS